MDRKNKKTLKTKKNQDRQTLLNDEDVPRIVIQRPSHENLPCAEDEVHVKNETLDREAQTRFKRVRKSGVGNGVNNCVCSENGNAANNGNITNIINGHGPHIIYTDDEYNDFSSQVSPIGWKISASPITSNTCGPDNVNIDLNSVTNDERDCKNNKNDDDEVLKKRRESLHRRNSISLPNLDVLKIPQEEPNVLATTSNLNLEESDNEEFSGTLGSFRPHVRRKSVISPKSNMLTPPSHEDFLDSNSPANSVTSVNSLASLLREKIQNFPQTFRNKKKSKDYGIKVFVILLFITIVVLICTAYFLYHQKILTKAYFEKIKFNKDQRVMKIFNNESIEVIQARLGTTLNFNTVLPCLPKDERKDGSICLEWMNRARLYLHYYLIQDNIKCYNLKWISLNEDVAPTDCFEMVPGVHWYGGGQTAENAWPLEKGFHDFHPFITGEVHKKEYGNVLKRYFINSKGAAILIDSSTPLHLSIRGAADKKELCLSARHDEFAFVNRFTETPHLNYSVCVGSNMSHLHTSLSEQTLWDGLKKEDADIIDILLTEPIWEMSFDSKEQLTEDAVTNFTNDVVNLNTFKLGHVLINEFWQKEVGDFSVDTERFPTMEKLIDMLARRGFRVVFSIQPFISTESKHFGEAVKKRLLISERFSDKRIPALTRYKTLEAAGVLDVSNNRTVPWLVEKLKTVMNQHKINAYYVDLGIAYNMPHYYQCEKPLINPDQYKSTFVNSILSAIPIFGVSSAIERPRSPTFVSLPRFESSWTGIRKVIPTILTYGIIGYPFLIPGAIGGDFEAPETKFLTKSRNESLNHLADEELYIRWLQLAAFLPVVRYNKLPHSYGVKRVTDAAISLAILRQNKVKPVLKKFARVSLNLGLPIIRPLWMLDANDPSCHLANDQFSLGDDIIVAPILYPDVRQREVYLPAGVWKDGIDGSLRKGSRWIHDYQVEENQIAFFEKMPDDTRF